MKKYFAIAFILLLVSCHKTEDADVSKVTILIYKAVPELVANDIAGGFFVLASNDHSPSSRSLIHFDANGAKTAEANLPKQTPTLQYQGMAVTSTNTCILLYSAIFKDSVKVYVQENSLSGEAFIQNDILLKTLSTDSFSWLASGVAINIQDHIYVSIYKKEKSTSSVKIQLNKYSLEGKLLATTTHHLNVYSEPLTQLPAIKATTLANGGIVLAAKGDDENYSGFVLSADANCSESWRLYSRDKGITGIFDLQQDVNSGNVVLLSKTGSIATENKDDFYLISLDNNGNEVWKQAVAAADGNIPNALKQTASGGFAITGNQAKYDVSGNLVLERSMLFVVFTDNVGQAPRMFTYGENPGSDGLAISEPSPGKFMLLARKASYGNYLNPDVMLVKINENGELR